jgi:hypothetical protein
MTSSITVAIRAYFSKKTDSVGGLPTTVLMPNIMTRMIPDTAERNRGET